MTAHKQSNQKNISRKLLESYNCIMDPNSKKVSSGKWGIPDEPKKDLSLVTQNKREKKNCSKWEAKTDDERDVN
jgi:hypothetical protein